MKIIYLWVIFLFAKSAVAQDHAEIVVWLGREKAGEDVVVNFPTTEGYFFFLNTQSHTVEKDGSIRIKAKLTGPGIVSLPAPQPLNLYLEPGKKVSVSAESGAARFEGDLQRENEFLSSLNRSGFAMALNEDLHPPAMKLLSSIPDTTTFYRSLDSLVANDLKKIDKFLTTNAGKVQFTDFVRADTRLFYLDLAFLSVSNRLKDYVYKPVARDEAVINSAWGIVLQRLGHQIRDFEAVDPAIMSQYYFWCLYDLMLRYHVWFLKENSVVSQEDNLARFQVDLFSIGVPTAANRLPGRQREFFLANYLSFYSSGSAQFFCKDQLQMFESFRDGFRNSTYSTVLERKSARVKESVGSFQLSKSPEGVTFLEDITPIDSFEQLKKYFKGKVVYVDIWATWCGPCIKEIENYGPLQNLARNEEDFSILFLSRDREESKERWRNFVKNRKMLGYHLMPATQLENELRNMIAWIEIPRYFIMGKDGQIVNPDAPRPGDPAVVTLIQSQLSQ